MGSSALKPSADRAAEEVSSRPTGEVDLATIKLLDKIQPIPQKCRRFIQINQSRAT